MVDLRSGSIAPLHGLVWKTPPHAEKNWICDDYELIAKMLETGSGILPWKVQTPCEYASLSVDSRWWKSSTS